jgi:hypothetical protein
MIVQSPPKDMTSPVELPVARARSALRIAARWPGAVQFAAIMLQLFLLAVLIKRYNVESPAFFQLALLTFGGFAVHYFLPLAYRLPFFLALSLSSICIILGPLQAAWLIGLGLALIGICHIPIAFWMRGVLLLVAGGLLTAMRVGWIPGPWPAAVWPLLASMFLFRMIVYFYDLRHATAATSLTKSLSYFFMLPNICFPLFPVVDYQTFCRSYFDGDRHQIYNVGLRWILRGVVQLLLYRILYKDFSIGFYDVANAGDLFYYCVWLYLLYLRVSGQFHLIVGMLHLFGFSLPETNHQYFLSSSFTDFWRRINIYWKDFMMKIFFYPSFVALRHLGIIRATVLATCVVFFMTWLLHAVLWLWLRGTLLVSLQDGLFYAILGGLVIVNSLWELKRGRKRLGRVTWRNACAIGLRTLMTFGVICLLWSMWTTESLPVWLELWRFALVAPTKSGWLLILGTITAIFATATILARRPVLVPLTLNQEAIIRFAIMSVLAFVSVSAVNRRLGYAGQLIASARTSGLNREDQVDLERGYYEGLLAVDKFNGELAELYAKMPPQWGMSLVDAGLAAARQDFQRFELKPSVEGMFKGAMLRTNRWGMHDKEYSLAPPQGGYRIAMIGASISMGTGVTRDQTFEALVEDRLNRENGGAIEGHYEILNFSVWAYRAIQQIEVLEKKVLPFKPNALFYIEHPGDTRRVIINLAEAISHETPPPYPFVRELCERAHVNSRVPEPIIRRRLQPHAMEILSWVYNRMVADCRANKIQPVFISLPPVGPEQESPNIELAKSAGFNIVDLKGVYDGHTRWKLMLSQWDSHPTPEGHQLVAERLFQELGKTGVIPMPSRVEPSPQTKAE